MTETAVASEAGNPTTMQQKYKVVFLGDPSVGKTSLIVRYTQDSFDVKYQVSVSPFTLAFSKTENSIVSMLLGNYWNRFFDENNVRGR